MPGNNPRLSDNAVAVLEMISAGSSYEQILAAYPHLTYLSIFDAAREALDLSVVGPVPEKMKITNIRCSHRRAYERWSESEDNRLGQFIQSGMTVAQIANRLERERSAIRSRIAKLNLVDQLNPHEQAELHRISALDPKDPAPE